ncbi:hypothetical protein D9758_009735 [Tetrapyrgos nigripes]|uniref:Heterokaryon incompatibility domain-containing protein n=1 Tax=Tetrapyrgos nigripes TaxID=182062 RepID=A0A8H5GJX1_9AGAR|nr:hypothetical protein D9758_009735 [Tetrapyrgos nigripes]
MDGIGCTSGFCCPVCASGYLYSGRFLIVQRICMDIWAPAIFHFAIVHVEFLGISKLLLPLHPDPSQHLNFLVDIIKTISVSAQPPLRLRFSVSLRPRYLNYLVSCTSLLTFLFEVTALIIELYPSRMSAPGMSADSTAVTTPPLLDPLQKRARPRRLVNACTIEVEEFPSDDSVSPYDILSHCWKQGQEVSYQEMVKCQSSIAAWLSIRAQSGYKKIVAACRQAREDNHTYIWIDTCCIDKGDHGQQSQDINSMFDYYKNAKVCYVYLNDYDSCQFDLCNMYKLGSPPPPLPSRYPIP